MAAQVTANWSSDLVKSNLFDCFRKKVMTGRVFGISCVDPEKRGRRDYQTALNSLLQRNQLSDRPMNELIRDKLCHNSCRRFDDLNLRCGGGLARVSSLNVKGTTFWDRRTIAVVKEHS